MDSQAGSESEGYFRHPMALVESTAIGAGSRIWAFAHVLPGAVIGADCNICDHVFIENDVVLGDRVTVKCGVQVWDGIRIEDDVFVGPNATFTNDPFPRSRRRPTAFSRTTVRAGASIGANATILPGLTIGRGAMVGAAAVVTHDVPPNAIVIGNPASIVGYVDARDAGRMAAAPGPAGLAANTRDLGVRGVRLFELPTFRDLRGSLSVAEFEKILPFAPRRLFVVHDVPTREVRGEHAHRELHQALICLKGRCNLLVDDGENRAEFVLEGPAVGVHLSPLVWGVQYRFSPDALLLVLASALYDAADYIRDYDEFRSLLASRAAGER